MKLYISEDELTKLFDKYIEEKYPEYNKEEFRWSAVDSSNSQIEHVHISYILLESNENSRKEGSFTGKVSGYVKSENV